MKKVNIKAIGIRVAGVSVGSVAGAAANKIQFVQNLAAWMRGGIKIGVGAILPSFAKAKPGDFVTSASDGLISVGAIELANAFLFKNNPVALSGMDTLPTLGRVPKRIYLDGKRNMAGVQGDSLPTLGEAPNTY